MGHYDPTKNKVKSVEKIEVSEGVAVVDEKKSSKYPVVDMECKKCGHGKAFFWTLQTRSSDESETKFYKCLKCDHTWRAYR